MKKILLFIIIASFISVVCEGVERLTLNMPCDIAYNKTVEFARMKKWEIEKDRKKHRVTMILRKAGHLETSGLIPRYVESENSLTVKLTGYEDKTEAAITIERIKGVINENTDMNKDVNKWNAVIEASEAWYPETTIKEYEEYVENAGSEDAKISENEYLKDLDFAVLVFQDINEDIDSSNIPWKDAQSKNISWDDFLNGIDASKNAQYIKGPQYKSVVNSTLRQINKYEYLANIAEKITPPDKYETINRSWIKAARSGAARMRASLDNIRQDQEKKKSNWKLYEYYKKIAFSDYNEFLSEYSKVRTNEMPNQYLTVFSGPFTAGYSFNVSRNYSYDLGDWGGSYEAGTFTVLKVVDNDVYSCSFQDLQADKWTKLDIKATRADLNGDKADEMIVPTTNDHINQYVMNKYYYYQLLKSE